jgi:hypothetical protein
MMIRRQLASEVGEERHRTGINEGHPSSTWGDKQDDGREGEMEKRNAWFVLTDLPSALQAASGTLKRTG